MKWTNLDKDYRNAHWHTVAPPLQKSIKAAKNWCNNYHFSGRYYNHYTNTRWWFEDEQDAMLFALKWSGR